MQTKAIAPDGISRINKIIKILIPFVRGLLIWINAVNLSITVISSIYSRLKTKKARCIYLQRAYTFFDALYLVTNVDIGVFLQIRLPL